MYNQGLPTPTFNNPPSSFGGFGGQFGPSLGLLGSGITNLFNRNPYQAASPYLNQIPGMLQGIYGPWINQGMGATQPYMQAAQGEMPQYLQQIQEMMANPGGMINQIGKNFQQSPGYQFQVQQAQNAVNNAAAAGGMAGSPQEQQQSASTVNQLANQDYYNWLNNAMGMYGMGMSGAQNVFNTGASTANNMYTAGANAANNLAQGTQTAMNNQAANAVNGGIYGNQSMSGGIGSILAGLGGLINAI